MMLPEDFAIYVHLAVTIVVYYGIDKKHCEVCNQVEGDALLCNRYDKAHYAECLPENGREGS